MRRLIVNPTFVGIFAVLIWGLSLPFVRFVKEQIGIIGYPVTAFTTMGILGLLSQFLGKQPFPDKAVFRNPYFYLRWFLFALNLVGVWTAVALVRRQFLPFVILLNYLWPTYIILCSILIAGVKITRRVVFTIGTLIVIAAIAIEVLDSDVLTSELFAQPNDRIAYLFAIIGSLSWGLYSAISRRAGPKSGGGSVLPIFQLSMGLGALPFSFMSGSTAWNSMTIGLAGVLSVWCVLNFLAYITWDIGMRKGNVVLLSLFADFTPWLSLIASHIILGVAIGQKTIFSAICLVIGAMITRYGTLPKKPKAQLKELAASLQPQPD